jgi:hypothetical protein
MSACSHHSEEHEEEEKKEKEKEKKKKNPMKMMMMTKRVQHNVCFLLHHGYKLFLFLCIF